MFQTLTRTEQGFEAQFGADHLGHFLFTSLIFPALRSAASPEFPARVVNISSLAVTFGNDMRLDDVSFELRPEEYGKYPGYIQAKSANVLFTRELAKRYKSENIISFSLHPGGMCDGIGHGRLERKAKLWLFPEAIFETNMGETMPVEDAITMGKPLTHRNKPNAVSLIRHDRA